MGRGSAYNITKENLAKVFDKIKEEKKELTGIELAKSFYEEYGKDMIHNNFSEYEDKIAVGFVGEGSERFGFDDVYSRDHDFGPGFCMWITEDVYEKIGEKLQDEYNKLPKSYKGITRVDTIMAEGRVGVCVVEDFYKKYTGSGDGNLTLEQWINLEDYKIATVTNGEVFRDDLGYFSKIRKNFENQPFKARLVKLARQLGAMAQTGQSNYERAMARKDYVTAQICISDFMKETMKCVYILNNKFAPYYKWLFKGVSSLDGTEKIVSLLEKLSQLPAQKNAWDGYLYDNTKFNEKDEKAIIMEEIAKIIIDKLLELKLIKNRNSNFLNDYVRPIMDLAEGKVEMFDREKTIDKIVKLEFEAFDKVQNVGGRASCQNNWPFFYVMRKSQYMTWTDEMLECICNLWEENKAKGWNKRKMWELADITLSRDGLVKGDRFIKELKQIIPDMNIEDLPVPYVAMATDIVRDQEVRFDRGSLHEAIRASISIPMLFRPLRKDGMVLIDGGILNPLPLSHVKRIEGDILIAVDVNAPLDSGKKKKISPYNLLTESSRMMMQQITRYQIERCQPDILIQMSGDTYDMLEFHHAASIVKTGVEVTRSVLKEFLDNE